MEQGQYINRSNIHIVQILERREKRAKEIFEKIFEKILCYINNRHQPQTEETQKTLTR